MGRLIVLVVSGLALVGCDGSRDLVPAGSPPEAWTAEMEAVVQRREALRYGLDRLQHEAASRRVLGLPVPDEPADQPPAATTGRPGRGP